MIAAPDYRMPLWAAMIAFNDDGKAGDDPYRLPFSDEDLDDVSEPVERMDAITGIIKEDGDDETWYPNVW